LIAPAIVHILFHASALPLSASATTFGHGTKSVEVSQELVDAARIAEGNAKARSTKSCWRYVKRALVASNVVDSYPDGISAKYAGKELTTNHGFQKLTYITEPHHAPVGSILVYGGRGHGHVEIKTRNGYVSDFKTTRPSKRPLTGVYVKVASS
jgi:hypothetical protein